MSAPADMGADANTPARSASLNVFPLLTSAAPGGGEVALRFEGCALTLTLRERKRHDENVVDTEASEELLSYGRKALDCALERFGLHAQLALDVEVDDETRHFLAAMAPTQRRLSIATPIALGALLGLRELAPGTGESLYLEDIESLLLQAGAIGHMQHRHLVQTALYGGAFLAGTAPEFEPLPVALPEGALIWVSGLLPASRAAWKEHESAALSRKRARGQSARAAVFGARATCGDGDATCALLDALRPDDQLLANSTGWLVAENALRRAPFNDVRVLAVGPTPDICLFHHDHNLLAQAADALIEVLAAHALHPAACGWLSSDPTTGARVE